MYFCGFETAALLNDAVNSRDFGVDQLIESVVRDSLQNATNLVSFRHRFIHFPATSENFLYAGQIRFCWRLGTGSQLLSCSCVATAQVLKDVT